MMFTLRVSERLMTQHALSPILKRHTTMRSTRARDEH